MSGRKGGSGGGRGGLHERVKTARRRTASSTRWLQRQLNDPYVRRAQAEGYRSRAAYKLLELDEKFGFLKKARAVVDLGITPGGWSQVVRKANPRAKVAGIDLLACEPIEGVAILEMDFMDDAAPDALLGALGAAPDLVISDMAANTVGHPQTDHLRTIGLAETAADFAVQTLQPGGTFVAKVFAGGADRELLTLLKTHFASVKHAKPPASRKGSPELYVVAQGFKGRAERDEKEE
ncbi:RlmE family RNA methyltransferase [Sphingopyxis indica]|uniref:Ribosomal RNA large subunit methyltransferase E n=1 Tax=Sphingopyxis indica TaxID=436663 RepID=A0A239HW91_9SPHN|nr:RlmE family RNA methyltransferase [Sphingopyxis indica]WOF43168.1 RlmE family RNA methyltransferase [Sphingopyxis indica]SNS85646.1 23S rRNA Um-2552 2'-O-methyltransferase [Sphingopyxis indica]